MDTAHWKLNPWTAGLLLALASALLRLEALWQTPFANGWDSYFYLVQIRSLEETGRMHSPEASLIYPYLRIVCWFTGDYVSGIKTGTALLAGCFTAVVYWLARIHKQEGAASHIPLVLAAWSVFSPHLTYFAAQYPKNLLGLVFLTAFIGSLNRVGQPPKAGLLWLGPVALLILNYFAHRLTFGLAVVYGGTWLLARTAATAQRRRFLLKSILAAGLALLVPAAAGRTFPGLFHVVDFERFSGILTWPPQFAPWSFINQFGMERISGWWLAEVLSVVGYWLLVLGSWLLVAGRRLPGPWKNLDAAERRQAAPAQRPLLALCTLLLYPFLEWSFTGIAWRFFLVFVLLTPLLVIDFQNEKRQRSGLVFAVFLLCCSFFSWKSYDPKMHDPDYARYATIKTRTHRALEDKKVDLVIAHNALAEFFTFTTGIDAMPWLPEYEIDSSRLWRIATGTRFQTLKYYAGKDNETLIEPVGFHYYLLPEYLWQKALRQAKSENDALFLAETGDWRNPSKRRPGWLLHRKRTY